MEASDNGTKSKSLQELAKNPLRLGLSMHVEVDMHNTDGSLVATQIRTAPQQLVTSGAHDAELNTKIADIIKNNSRSIKPAASGVL